MPLIPPANQAGIELPQVPKNPPVYADITHAMDYVNRLNESRTRTSRPGDLRLLPKATDQEVGLAEAYKTALVFAVAAADTPAPPWVQMLQASIAKLLQPMANDVAANRADITQLRSELPFRLANTAASSENQDAHNTQPQDTNRIDAVFW